MFDNLVIISQLTIEEILVCVRCDTLELVKILCGMLDRHCTQYAVIDNIVYTNACTINNFKKWDFLHDGMTVIEI